MDAELKAKKLREDERIFQTIDECISTKNDLYERNKGILKEILEDVFTTIKGRDRFFRKQFQSFFFVENYYKGLQVGKPQEFNVAIIIKIPLDFKNLEIVKAKAGYCQLRFPTDNSIYTPQWHDYSNFMSGWLVSYEVCLRKYVKALNKDVFRQSIERLLAWAVLNIPRIDSYTIKMCEDGSAFTVCVNKQNVPEMNVTLMPVVEFDCKPPLSSAKEGFKWYAVPEPLKVVEGQCLLWRLAVYNHENDILSRHSYLIPVIRQLEKLRNNREWNAISHYHIKTLAMHYAESMENDAGLPDTCRLTGIQLFIHMLDRLRHTCTTHDLGDFWDSKCNLINADDSQLADIVEQLTRMINEITDDSAKVADWILTPEELIVYQNELKAAAVPQHTDCLSGSLQTSEDNEPDASKDLRNPAESVSKPVAGAGAASGGIESSPSNEAGKDIGVWDAIDMLSCRLTALEQKSAATA